jgi:energy-coupling factor transporter ATP-binding protein EcfA2
MSDNRLDKVTYMGETDFRNGRTRFGIRNIDRARHMYVIGKTGMGKSTLLENMAAQDIQNGEGICFIDPHGSSAELMLEYVPEDRIQDVLYFAPFDTDFPVAFNPLEDVDPDKRHLVASGLMSAFKKIWVDAFSARMEYILSNAILALLEYPDSTLLSVNRMLVEKEFRKKIVDNITDPTVKAFWVDEYEKWDDRYRKEAGAAIQNKVGQFVSNPLIRNIVGQPKSSFDLREMMDNRKILIVNLSKGQIGEQNAGLLGGMFITKLYLAAMSRADLERSEMDALPPFYFYVDEFQSFANESFADILSEARKYKLALTVAHQYVAQMPDEVREAIFGNVGSMVVFRVGPGDAEHFEREFAPVFTEQDIVNIGRFQYYLRLMIDGMGSNPFSAVGMYPLEKPPSSNKKAVVEMSRSKYADTRAEVDKRITEWYVPIPSEKDLEHQAYIEKKKKEFAAQGKEWVDFSKDPEKKAEYEKEKAKREANRQNNKSNNNYQKPRPKKDFSKSRRPEPKVSPKLKDLITAIESGDAKPVESKEEPKKDFKKEDSKEKKEVSLNDLSFAQKEKKLTRKAPQKTVMSLKDALMKAGVAKAEEPKNTEFKKEVLDEKPVVKKEAVKTEEPKKEEQDRSRPLSHQPKKEEPKRGPLLEKRPEPISLKRPEPKAEQTFVAKTPPPVPPSSKKYSPDELLETILNS